MKITDKYTLFWSGPFSQWDLTWFTDNEGIEYFCAEQYMMSKKALLFHDAEINELIMTADHPNKCKKLGREVRDFCPIIWQANALQIVYQGSQFKYQQNPDSLKELLKTRGTILVEASPFDKLWGIGLRENDEQALDNKTWLGKNWLGYTLTNLRDNYFKV